MPSNATHPQDAQTNSAGSSNPDGDRRDVSSGAVPSRLLRSDGTVDIDAVSAWLSRAADACEQLQAQVKSLEKKNQELRADRDRERHMKNSARAQINQLTIEMLNLAENYADSDFM